MSNSIKDAIAYIYTRKGIVSDRDEDEGITLYTYKPYDVIQGFEVNEKGKRKFFANDGTDYSYIEDIIEMGDDYVYAFPYYLYKDEKEKADAISDELFERFEKSEKYMLFQLYNDNSSTIQTVATTDQSTFSTVDVSTYDGFNNMLNAEYKAITPEIKALCVVENKEDKAKNVNNGSTSNINTNGMYDHITSSVICQDSQIRSIVTGFAKNQRINEAILHNPNLRDLLIENKQNFLVCGPTGVGKTAIFNSLASYANVPMIKEDSTQYTMEGYVGQSIIEVLKNIYKAADGDLEKAQQGIIVMDEFDKKALRNDVSPAVTSEVQSSFLAMATGQKYRINISKDKNIEFDTSMLTFAFLGAFSGIEKFQEKKSSIGFGDNVEFRKDQSTDYSGLYTPENLIKYGMKPEFIGRTNLIALNSISNVSSMIKILLESNKSPLKSNQLLYSLSGINLILNSDAVEELAKKAITYKSGARGLKQAMNEIFNEAEFEIFGERTPREVIITKESITNPSKLVLKY